MRLLFEILLFTIIVLIVARILYPLFIKRGGEDESDS